MDVIFDAEEHDVAEHGGEDQRESARQSLYARKRAVRGTREDAHPQVFVSQILHRPGAQHVTELGLSGDRQLLDD